MPSRGRRSREVAAQTAAARRSASWITRSEQYSARPMKTGKARVDELAKLLRKYKDAYYNATPLVSDAAYDALEDELRELDPEHELLKSVGAPAPAAGAAPAAGGVTAWEKARHAIPMGSLNKAVTEEELRAWAARCEELGRKAG